MPEPSSPQPIPALARDERWPLYEHVWASKMFQQWHWWQWNFDVVRQVDQESPFAIVVLDALLRCDDLMPGYATEMLDRVASFGVGTGISTTTSDAVNGWANSSLSTTSLRGRGQPQSPSSTNRPSRREEPTRRSS